MHKTSYKTLDTKRTRFQEQEKILPILLSRIRNTKLPLFWEVVLDLIELFILLYKGNNPIVSIFVFSLINVKKYGLYDFNFRFGRKIVVIPIKCCKVENALSSIAFILDP